MKKRIISITLILAILIAILPLSACTKTAENSYKIDVLLNTETKTITVTQETTYYHQSETETSTVCFNLYQNTTREDAQYTAVPKEMKFSAYPNGNSYGGILFASVTIGENNANFEVGGTDENFLIINLETPLQNGDSVTISMEYQVTLANINSRLGYGEDTINLGNFYPTLAVFEETENGGEFFECVPYSLGDPFFTTPATFEVSITLPSEYLVASSGVETKTQTENSTKTITYKADNIKSFCMVCSDKFTLQTQIKNGIEIKYYSLADASPTTTTAMIAKALDLYETSFGSYEYETFTVTDANFFQGGMEYSALVMVSTSVDEDFRKIVIAHETAHQWWQTMVGTNEIEYSIFDEGLTEFSTALFFETYPEYGISSDAMITAKEETYATYLEILNVLEEKTPPTPTQSLASYRSSYDYYALVYVRGHLIFEEMADMIGQDEFISFLKAFKTKYNMQNVDIEDFLSFAEEKLGAETAEKMRIMFYPN